MDINKEIVNSKNLSFKNPSYNTETGAAIWSYIYFGSYPQIEVKGDNLLKEITGAEYDKNGDTYVNGIKYRRISKENTENNKFFGDSDFRYFKWEKIKWRVLFNDGKTLFVMADQGIDCKNYNYLEKPVKKPVKSVTWEECTLRQWLNNDFLNTAFNPIEQKAIVTYEVQNLPTPKYGHGNGNNTVDKIYLLSILETRNPAYGLWEEKIDWTHKKDKKINRRIKPSDYAHARGVRVCTSKDVKIYVEAIGNCYWWLRSCSRYTEYYGSRNSWFGDIGDSFAGSASIYENAVVPVMHLDLKELPGIL